MWFLSTPENDYQTDIVFVNKEHFKNSISEEDFNNLNYLFCIDSMENTRIFASNKRNLCLTYKYRNKFNLKKDYGYSAIDRCLKGMELVVFRRRVDSNGKKINNEYVMEKGYYEGLDILGHGYDSLNIKVNIDGELKKYIPERVYIMD